MTDEAVAMAFVDCTATSEGKADLQDSEDITLMLLDYDEVCRLCDATDMRIRRQDVEYLAPQKHEQQGLGCGRKSGNTNTPRAFRAGGRQHA